MNEHVVIDTRGVGYDTDFYEWAAQQAELLRSGRVDLIDAENLAEEIESLGKRDRRGIESQLRRLIAHLLKLQYSNDDDPRGGWIDTVDDARTEIAAVIRDSGSLRRELPELFEQQWPKGFNKALRGLRRDDERALLALVAITPSFTVDDALSEKFVTVGVSD